MTGFWKRNYSTLWKCRIPAKRKGTPGKGNSTYETLGVPEETAANIILNCSPAKEHAHAGESCWPEGVHLMDVSRHTGDTGMATACWSLRYSNTLEEIVSREGRRRAKGAMITKVYLNFSSEWGSLRVARYSSVGRLLLQYAYIHSGKQISLVTC